MSSPGHQLSSAQGSVRAAVIRCRARVSNAVVEMIKELESHEGLTPRSITINLADISTYAENRHILRSVEIDVQPVEK